jgi:2,4-dienoyl-CoA reductase-like NADH-dependent reductase (Old Yellow Enzyme family)
MSAVVIDSVPSSPLFEPLRIGGILVPNRIMQTAHSKQYSDRVESDRETAYFVRRAHGGCSPRTIDAAIFDAVELAYEVIGLAASPGHPVR